MPNGAFRCTGKTTVIAPLLVAILADGTSLVTQVVPPALLDMASTVMRNAFSNVFRKRVLTLDFTRGTLQRQLQQSLDRAKAEAEEARKEAQLNGVRRPAAAPPRQDTRGVKPWPVPELSEHGKILVAAVRRLFTRLSNARRRGSVVVTSPESVKSLLLKFIEYLKLAATLTPEGPNGHTRGSGTNSDATEQEPSEPSDTASEQLSAYDAETIAVALGAVLELFSAKYRGIALLDEVDMILHPLKSELNFPIGRRVNLTPLPERVTLPMHLIDAVLFAHCGTLSLSLLSHAATSGSGVGVSDVPESLAVFATGKADRACLPSWTHARQAGHLLQAIAQVVRYGQREFALQHSPHLISLDVEWYNRHLRPLVALWANHYLLSQRCVHDDCQAVCRRDNTGAGASAGAGAGAGASAGAGAATTEDAETGVRLEFEQVADVMAAYVAGEATAPHINASPGQWIVRELSANTVRLLNLARSWVVTYLPHCLAKVNRVAYGLLRWEHGAALFQHAPLSRKLLAVPFVGKDVPSPASEFANPEVLIGLTVLALRHEGMRMSDLRSAVEHLKRSMLQESGAIVERPSRRMFDSWLAATEGATDSVLPLELFQIDDNTQMLRLMKRVQRHPQLIAYWLQQLVFPRVLKYQCTKLTASGHDIGGRLLFGVRLGFSGTPSDLLPKSLGKPGCVHGVDG